ncbi:hypothetical protein M2137_002734 [Parabacteroides sp. PFB2-10]|uniref:NVEALA domain-containing protein n=1 Tax=Parabacteroides sp. PFB2-10 TaxID=1742405 RepID=UPI002476686E|nr:NVEALA domain-containing protein [Parabacteroides sp. PFB2-10]MDH6313942.1 hypothetical protein [Parabacteroides sp. PFB2-10]
MKKKICVFFVLFAFFVTVIINVSLNSQNKVFPELALANIEALARNENGGVSCTDITKEIYSDGCLYYCCLGTDGKWYSLYTIHCDAK